MSITVPDCLYGKENNFSHFTTTSLEVLCYHHQCSEVINEVILDKNLLLFVNSGIKQLKISDEKTTLSALQGAFIPKGSYVMTEMSSAATQHGFESLMVLIEDDFLIDFYAKRTPQLPAINDPPLCREPMAPWVKFDKTPFLDISMLSFRVFFDYPDRVNTLFLEEKVREILLYLLDTDCSRQLLTHMRFIASGGRNAKLRHFLERNYTQPWSVEDFAERFGLSVSTFKRECKNVLDMSPKRWINRRRLDCARQQLRCGSESLTRIAMKLGFADSSHFSKMFRKEFNCSPSAYRSLKPKPGAPPLAVSDGDVQGAPSVSEVPPWLHSGDALAHARRSAETSDTTLSS
ncbi:AraC family transcriptional regulator [Pseudomonas sp. 2FE]|uniref:helix-turn-helix transcriptional regulator n=1 Tax=Pseudomonas sp. 2FE TaxID=2502190 RepID=UPI0010F94944|nr:AraC family transcriptional regulator [Pseudomonas sp. 2FE]